MRTACRALTASRWLRRSGSPAPSRLVSRAGGAAASCRGSLRGHLGFAVAGRSCSVGAEYVVAAVFPVRYAPIAIPSPSPSCHATLCSRIEIHAAQSSTTLRRQVVVDSYTGGFPEIRMLQCSIRLASTLTRCTLQRLVVNQELMNGSQHQTQIPEIPVPAFDYPTTTTARSQLRGRNSNSVNILSSLITDPPPFLYWHQSSSAAEIFAAS